MKAIRVPSGDHEIEDSSHLLLVKRSILLVAITFDNDRLRWFRRRAWRRSGIRIGRIWIRIANYQRQTLRIRRPFVTLQAAFQLSELISLAAAAIQQPHLTALRFARPRRSERKILAVGTPARRTLAVVTKCDLPTVLSVKADHPDM